MELEVSDKTANYGVKPRIEKGYYPMQFLSVKGFTDENGKLKEKKYGRMLIMQFSIFNKDGQGKPTEIMMFESEDESGQKTSNKVILSKFVYHQYKNDKGEYRTAITPKSALTKILEALGWKFDASKPVDMKSFVGSWVEGNINDYKNEKTDETFSTIEKIEKYRGPTVGADVSTGEAPKTVKKQVKSEKLSDETVVIEKLEITSEHNAEQKKVMDKINTIREMRESGALSEDAYKTAMKNLKAELEQAKK